ncbi:CCR3: C-C chemokine receptor type 3 [Crotalus adamanteus]|uniref:CCR3: C-C chemokine receptor type 3 n=1 Tax=Crotalus adamanteus TaxID=8729 RepID=A0AAW1B3E5_CROAD
MLGKIFLPKLYGLVFTIGLLFGKKHHWISSPSVHHKLLLSADHQNIDVLQKPVQTKSYESDFTCRNCIFSFLDSISPFTFSASATVL